MAKKRHEELGRDVGEESGGAPGTAGSGDGSLAGPPEPTDSANPGRTASSDEKVEARLASGEAAVEAPSPEAVEEEVAELELEGEMDRLQGELEALNDRHVRLAAEFENYRKRIDRERTETWTRAQADVVRRLVDILDDLERVTAVDPGGMNADALLEGVGLVHRKFLKALEHAGLAAFDPTDQPFDPTTMEAVMVAAVNEGEADETVAQVFQKGYTFKGHLVRPARVVVRKHG